MNYHIITIFPEIFDSFLSTSLIARAIADEKISVDLINPRDFCTDKQRQIDDEPYGGWAGMLLKAQPMIDAIKYIEEKREREKEKRKFKIIILNPSETIYDQEIAHELVDSHTDIILICGRYEGIDERVSLRCKQQFWENFQTISLGKYVTMGGEIPAMSIVESTARLIPWVIKEECSWQKESYRPGQELNTIEHPHYTRPQEVEWFEVPEVLLSGHHEEIRKWREWWN